MSHTLMYASLLALSVLAFSPGAFAQQVGPWDLGKLRETPAFEKVDVASKPGVTSMVYQSIPYQGHPVGVFAYYGVPQGDAPEGGWPAVVCVHGGGGTAFDAWVKKWNAKGYAAISMDLEGHYPLSKSGSKKKNERVGVEQGGPSRDGVFSDFAKPLDQQWYTHAVAQVILAHSLIRSFSEVNADQVGMTGISWGGNLTSTVMGLDDRLKFAIPVYGCGFLADSDGRMGEAIEDGMHTEIVNQYFDGSAYFDQVTYPTFWVNGTNDKHFPMPATQQSVDAVNGAVTLRYALQMPHGHKPGWRPEEIYVFADSVVKGGTPLVAIESIAAEAGVMVATVRCHSGIRNAELLYTVDTSVWPKRAWQRVPASVDGDTVSADLPAGVTAAYLAVTDDRGLMVSSRLVELGAASVSE